jgi:hypothetical protein
MSIRTHTRASRRRSASGARITVSDTGIVIDNGRGASITLTGNTVHITGVMV